MIEKIGLIGIGRMGYQMGVNLINANYAVTGFDIDDDRILHFQEAGAEGANSISEVMQKSEAILTSLPDDKVVEQVYLEPDGIVDNVRDGSLLIETSTISPQLMKKIGWGVEDADVDIVDSPVIGIPTEAADAQLTVLLGGDHESVERAAPLLRNIGNRIEHVGRIGDGKKIKLANNIITFGNFAIAAEIQAMIAQLNVDPELFYSIFSSGPASSAIADSKMPKALSDDFAPGFTIKGVCKDLGLAMNLKNEIQYDAPIFTEIWNSYNSAMEIGYTNDDYSAMLEFFKSNS